MRGGNIAYAAYAAIIGCLFAGPRAYAAGPALSPAPGAKDIPPDTQLHLKFSGPVTLGTGGKISVAADNGAVIDSFDATAPTALPAGPGATEAQMKASFMLLPRRAKMIGGTSYITYPVLLDGNEAIITLEKPLTYGQKVTATIDPGVFNVAGVPDTGSDAAHPWSFTVKPAPPAAGSRKITVSTDGTDDFCTVQGAVDSIAPGNTPTTIFIRSGTYHEMVNFTGKNNLTFLGEDRKKTIIAYPDNDRFSNSMPTIGAAPGRGGGGYRRGMFQAVRVSDIALANLTLHNTTPQGGSQAESIILNGNANSRAILTNVDLYSYQDTLQINGQAYISHCYIEGDVDFMWGSGPCFFENCEARAMRDKAYYAQVRNSANNHGYVYYHCLFDGAPNITDNVLNRIAATQYPACEVVLIDCALTPAVGPVGWVVTGGTSPTIHYWEFNSHDPAGNPIDTSKRLALSKQLKQPDDAEAIKNYSDATWVLGQWMPKLAPIIGGPPMAHVSAGGKATLTVAVAAVPAPTYAWQKNGAPIAGANKATLNVDNFVPADAGKYAVIITNSAGTATSGAAVLDSSPGGQGPQLNEAAPIPGPRRYVVMNGPAVESLDGIEEFSAASPTK